NHLKCADAHGLVLRSNPAFTCRAYFLPLLLSLAAGFFAAAFFAGAFFSLAAGFAALGGSAGFAASMVTTSAAGAALRGPGPSVSPSRPAASLDRYRRSCRSKSYGCKACGATSFTPSRFRLASSRLRFAAISHQRLVFVAAPRRPSASRNGLVLCDSSCQASTTVSFSSASFAESAERSAPKTILRGNR